MASSPELRRSCFEKITPRASFRSLSVLLAFLIELLGISAANAKPPYPIVLIHGLLGSPETTWINPGLVSHLESFGWTLGGTFHFDLGRHDTLTDVTILREDISSAGGDIWLIDYNADSESDQAAIYLQAQALKLALQRIRSLTGTDKVILVGHSMGGLAAAAYLTGRPTGTRLYQNDVAKLLTLGTPFGGSVFAVFAGLIASDSNALRDLRTSQSPGNQNVFLFGGLESSVGSFYQDVNCNCPTQSALCLSDDIRGIRQMTYPGDWPPDISYFWLIGNRDGSDGDCAVIATNQQLAFGERKQIDAAHTNLVACGAICTEAESLDAFIEGLDEGDDLPTAWRVLWNGTLDGFITHQGDGGSTIDRDVYRFRLTGPQRVTVDFDAAPVPVILEILQESGTIIRSKSISANEHQTFEQVFDSSFLYPQDFFIRVQGSAPASESGIGTSGTSCSLSYHPTTRQPYHLKVGPTPPGTVDLTASPATASVGQPVTLSAVVRRADGTSVGAGIQVAFSPIFSGTYLGCSIAGGVCSTATDSTGKAMIQFTSPAAGTFNFAAVAETGGSDRALVTFLQGGIQVSASPNPVPIDQPSTLSVDVIDGTGKPVPAGHTVTFSTSYPGVFSGNGATSSGSPSVLTDSTGHTWIRFASSATGTAQITVESGSATPAVVPVQIYNPNSSLRVQITAGFVNGDSSSSTYEIQAVVTNTSGQPVAGEPVNFTTSRGTLSASRDFTGPSGIADVNLTITTSGEVTVTATAGGASAATSFQGQVGGGNSGPMFPVRTFSLLDDVYGLGFTPDGATLIAASYGQDLRAWNTADGSARWSGTARDDRLGQLSVSPDGTKFLVTANDGTQIHRVSDGGWICEGTNAESKHYLAAWISSASYIDSSFTQLYRYNSQCGVGASIATLPATGDTYERGQHLDFSPTRGWVAATTDEGRLFVYTTSGSLVTQQTISPGASAYDVDFSANGSRLAAVGWRSVKVFDTGTWSATTYGFQALGDFKYGVAFLDNDTKLAVGGDGKVEVVDLASGASLRVGSVDGRAWEIAWNQATGHLAVGTSAGSVYVFAPLAPVDTQAPIISVSAPADGFVTNATTLTTTGRVSDNTAVTTFTINGTPVPLDGTGNFSFVVALAPGANNLVYSAADAAGNTATLQRLVTRTMDTTPPVISGVAVTPQTGPAGTLFKISCTVVDGDSGVASVFADLVPAAGGTPVRAQLVRGTGDTYSATWDSRGFASGSIRVDLSSSDTSPSCNTRKVTGAASFTIAAPPPPGLDFYTVSPCRAVDTRPGAPLASQTARYLRLAGLCGIPTGAKSVSVNLTVVGSTGSGHVTLWPADLAKPGASSINFSAGQIRANNAILPLSTDGIGDIAAESFILGGGTVHLLIDVNGYFQ